MANIFADIPVPAADGTGAAVDVSAFGKVRTLTADGDFDGGAVTFEISNDAGATFVPWVTVTANAKRVLDIAAQFVRARLAGSNGATAVNADIGANDDGVQLANLPAPAADGLGASIDVSALGTFNTVIVTGDFTGVLNVQVSEDNVDFEDCMTFVGPGEQSKEFTANFMRVQRVGSTVGAPGAAQVDVAAVNESSSGSSGAIAAPRQCLVFQPGGVAGGNVYNDWDALVAALGNIAGPSCIFFDDELVSPIVIPAGGPYDMKDCTWTAKNRTSDDFASQIPVNIADGATFTDLLSFDGNLLVTSLGASPMALSPGDLVEIVNGATVQSNNAAAFFDGTGIGGGQAAIFKLDDVGTLGDGTNPVFAFPTAGSFCVLTLGNQAFVDADAIDVAAGATLQVVWRATSAVIAGTQTAFLGSLVRLNLAINRHRVRITDGATPVSAAVGDLIAADPTGGAIDVNLPAITQFNEGLEVVVKNNSASTNNITVNPAGADTIDGAASAVISTGRASLTFVSDGVGNWNII